MKPIESINRYDKAKLEDINNTALVDYCEEWLVALQEKPSPFVSGSVGAGKTYFLYTLRNRLRKQYDPFSGVLLCSSAEIIFDIKNGIATNNSSQILDRYKNVKILLMDDLGAERITDWTQEQLYLITDYRWTRCLPTVITSNYTLANIAETLGERIASRLAGLSKFFVLEGKDRRLKD